jgi:ASC-1-like (ASCH) protein
MIGRRIHNLKTWTEYFEAVCDGRKTFEIRKNDRDFRVNDVLLLREYDPKTDTYSGRELWATVTYLTDYGQPPGQVVMSITAGPMQYKG